MGLNDETEKLRTAREWLFTRRPGSQDWEAAWEHVRWVLWNTPYAGLRTEAQAIADKVLRDGLLPAASYE